jgi:uncharacterized protein (TIGR03084 family)
MATGPGPFPTSPRERVLADLAAEGDELDGLVAPLDADQWARPTPAPGWSIAHQIAHLASTDVASVAAVTYASGAGATLRGLTDPGLLLASARAAGTTGWWLLRRGPRRWTAAELDGLIDALAAAGARAAPATVLARWRQGRARLAGALSSVPPAAKVPWLGARMSPASIATARLMETWAHGQDVADALGVERKPTERLYHIARLGVRTRDHAYRVHGRPPPPAEFRFELTAPDGTEWAWGPDEATDRVTGSAHDFCLLVTRRRHPADLDVTAHGAAADWLPIAQAFAGSPGPGRDPAGE